MAEREEAVEMARLAEKAERYEDMAQAMKGVAEMGKELEAEERKLLSSAYKSVVVALRASFRSLAALEERSKESSPEKQGRIKKYKQEIGSELKKVCLEVLSLLSEHLLPRTSDKESKAFYKKMEGDCNRYLAEIDEEGSFRSKSRAAYEEASRIAREFLPATNHTRLGVALNFSVFHYEIMASPEEAQKEAKRAFEEAIAQLDNMTTDEEWYQETATLMKLLKDNLQLWGDESEEDSVGQP